MPTEKRVIREFLAVLVEMKNVEFLVLFMEKRIVLLSGYFGPI